MKLRPLLYASIGPWLLAAAFGGAMLWSDSAVLAARGANAKAKSKTTKVRVAGEVTGYPETVSFSGKALVSTTVVKDPDFGDPDSVVISIDLSTVRAVGAATKKKYAISGPHILIRTLASSDFVDFTFSILDGGENASARTGYATFSPIFKGASAGLRPSVLTISTP